jgi:hypothetical protein
MEYNIYNLNCEKEITEKIIIKKNIKNKHTNNILLLQNKILELEKKLEFYQKYEDNLNSTDLNLVNKTIESIDKIIHTLDKNFISKGQIRNTCANTAKQIELEF